MDIQTIGYILLVVTLLVYIVLLVRADRTIEMLEDEVELNANSAAFWCGLYALAIEANNSMAEGLEQYRTTFGDLAEEGALAPVAPATDTDTVIAAMKYCLACHGYKHPPHFVIYPLHASGAPPA
jgi:hypothetical protein